MLIHCRSGFLPIGPQLQRKEDEYRIANPSWVDQTEVPDDLRQKWHEAQANRRMQFKVGTFKSSEIRVLTCTLKADWIQLPVENYLAMFPTLKQGVIAGVFKIKGASPWAITRAEKLQVSLFLPNKQSMDSGLCLAYGVARCIHDGDEQYAHWLRLSLHAEEVPGAWHVGHCSPAVAPFEAASGGVG